MGRLDDLHFVSQLDSSGFVWGLEALEALLRAPSSFAVRVFGCE